MTPAATGSTAMSRRMLVVLLLAFAALWFGAIDQRRLLNPDEGRYAEIPREMVASGDWLTPRLNDLKYFEKPPLQYWATATAFTLFGEHHWTARFWSALTGFMGVLFAGFAAARLFGHSVGLMTAAVTASALLWNLIGHLNTLDMGVSFFLSAAVFSLCLAQRDDASVLGRQRWQDAAWASLALAVLSKGLIGLLLPGATVVAYALWQRDWGFILRIRPLRGLLILLLITAPWFIAVSLANPEFARFFFIHEHLDRFLTKTHGRYQPVWYFIPILILGMLPWITGLMPGLLAGLRQRAGLRFQPARFLFVWTVLVFAFFSLSSSKLPSYILPIMPSLAALISLYLSAPSRKLQGHAVFVAALGTGCLLLIPFILELSGSDISEELYASYKPWLYAGSAALASGGLAGFILARKNHNTAAIAAMAVGGFFFGQGFLLGHDGIGKEISAYDVVKTIKPLVPDYVPFYSVNTFDHTFQFYLKRTTTLVAYRDELSFGVAQEPEKFIVDLANFEKIWRAAPVAWALMPPSTWAELQAKGLPMIEVTRDIRRVIVRKP